MSNKFVMIRSTDEEKAEYREAARERGMGTTSAWFRWLAKKDMRAIKLQDKPKV